MAKKLSVGWLIWGAILGFLLALVVRQFLGEG